MKNDIAAELLAASQSASQEVHNVSVIELVGDAGENITCHYEILLNIQSEMSDDLETTLALSGMDYANGLVRLQGEFISFVQLSFSIAIEIEVSKPSFLMIFLGIWSDGWPSSSYFFVFSTRNVPQGKLLGLTE